MVPSLGAGAGAWCPAVSRRREPGERIVRAEGLEPSRAVKLNGFSYHLRLSPPGRGALEAHASGLWSGLSLHHTPESPGL